MAALGSLVVSLGLDAAQFTAGLSKAEYQARKLGESIGSNIRSAALVTTGALAGLGTAAIAANAAFNALLDEAAKFQDLAEMTGASAEGIASFAVAAATAGVQIESVAAATIKLTKNLVGVDDESKAAGAALAAIGIKVDEFKKLDPAAQYETVSKALAGYADGAGKTAVALALFGKSGAEQLKVMKALEEQGGRQKILTQEQIDQADAYRDAQAKLTAEFGLYASAIATEFIGPTNALIGVLKDAAAEILNAGAAAGDLARNGGVRAFAEDAGRALAGFMDYVKQSAAELRVLIDFANSSLTALKQAASFDFSGVRKTSEEFRARYGLDELGRKVQQDSGKEAAKTFVQAYNEQLAASKRTAFAATDPRRLDLGANGKPVDNRGTINFGGGVKPPKASGGGRSSGAAKDPFAEAQRYLEGLQKQLEKTQELTVQEQVLRDLQMGRLGQVSAAQKDQLLNIAGQIDAARAAEEADKKRAEAAEQAARAQKSLMDEGARLYEETRTPLEQFNAAQDRLNTLLESGAIDFVTAARAGEQYKKTLDESTKVVTQMDEFAKNAAENIQRSLGDTLVDVMNGNFKTIGKGFADMLQRMAAEALAAQIARKLFGSISGGEGEGWLGGVLKLFGSAVGGKAAGGSVSPFSMHRVNEQGPELLDVNGKQYLMNGNRNARVTPNSKIGGGMSVSQAFYLNEPASRKTQSQVALEARRGLQHAGRNA